MTEPKPSKSARKREYLKLQKMGEELIKLRVEELDALPLDDDLRDAVIEAKGIRAHSALRRQKQYIGKLMRQIDPEPLREALAKMRR